MIYLVPWPGWLLKYIYHARTEHALLGNDCVDFPEYLGSIGVRIVPKTTSVQVDDDTAITARLKFGAV